MTAKLSALIKIVQQSSLVEIINNTHSSSVFNRLGKKHHKNDADKL